MACTPQSTNLCTFIYIDFYAQCALRTSHLCICVGAMHWRRVRKSHLQLLEVPVLVHSNSHERYIHNAKETILFVYVHCEIQPLVLNTIYGGTPISTWHQRSIRIHCYCTIDCKIRCTQYKKPKTYKILHIHLLQRCDRVRKTMTAFRI